eukprot:1183254-Prorocentrum_minimum.AAC.1
MARWHDKGRSSGVIAKLSRSLVQARNSRHPQVEMFPDATQPHPRGCGINRAPTVVEHSKAPSFLESVWMLIWLVGRKRPIFRTLDPRTFRFPSEPSTVLTVTDVPSSSSLCPSRSKLGA